MGKCLLTSHNKELYTWEIALDCFLIETFAFIKQEWMAKYNKYFFLYCYVISVTVDYAHGKLIMGLEISEWIRYLERKWIKMPLGFVVFTLANCSGTCQNFDRPYQVGHPFSIYVCYQCKTMSTNHMAKHPHKHISWIQIPLNCFRGWKNCPYNPKRLITLKYH